MERRHVSLTTETGRGIPGLKEAGVPAVFCDAVGVDLGECTLLYISVGCRPTPTARSRARP